MGKSQEIKPLRPKEYYRDRIVKIVSEIQSEKILQYIYIIVTDVSQEVSNEQQKENDLRHKQAWT